MIYTVTVNPTLDYVLQLEKVNTGEVNRTNGCQFLVGGKGVNVSQISNQLKTDNTAWGFVSGFTGTELAHQLNQKRIISDFVKIPGTTRVDVKIHAEVESEINVAEPRITEQGIAAFKSRLADLNEGDTVVISGSLTPSLGTDFYKDLLPTIKEAGAESVVDITGQALLDTLEYKPLVIKPNHHELADLFGVTFNSNEEVLTYAKKLLDIGAQNVTISMAKDGGHLVTQDGVYHTAGAKGVAVNSVGAGDSVIAGFVGTYLETKNSVEAFRIGMACGAATAFTKDTVVKSQVDAVLPQIKVEEVE